jgi:hypothetical protein
LSKGHEEVEMSILEMSIQSAPALRIGVRNAALVEAEVRRAEAIRDAEVEYSETVWKLRERFEADIAEAAARRLTAVTPAHRAYNAAVIAAEQASE